jgi:hypothetical protein
MHPVGLCCGNDGHQVPREIFYGAWKRLEGESLVKLDLPRMPPAGEPEAKVEELEERKERKFVVSVEAVADWCCWMSLTGGCGASGTWLFDNVTLKLPGSHEGDPPVVENLCLANALPRVVALFPKQDLEPKVYCDTTKELSAPVLYWTTRAHSPLSLSLG